MKEQRFEKVRIFRKDIDKEMTIIFVGMIIGFIMGTWNVMFVNENLTVRIILTVLGIIAIIWISLSSTETYWVKQERDK